MIYDKEEMLFNALAPREKKVFLLMISGLGKNIIAENMGITRNTSRIYMSNIYTKVSSFGYNLGRSQKLAKITSFFLGSKLEKRLKKTANN
jgi:FixJ family two-component response regulator